MAQCNDKGKGPVFIREARPARLRLYFTIEHNAKWGLASQAMIVKDFIGVIGTNRKVSPAQTRNCSRGARGGSGHSDHSLGTGSSLYTARIPAPSVRFQV